MERPGDGNLLEIIDLAHSLRQEHLYITNEQKMFRTLNATLQANASNVAQLAWICAQQRQNLNSLIVSRAGTETGPAVCCHRANQLANTKFIEAHKARDIKYQHVLSYIELFNFLHRSPFLLAQSLAVGDRDGRLNGQFMTSVVHTIVGGLYGNAIMSKDVDMLLRLLRELIEIQIVVSDNPRRLLRSSTSSAFSRLYHRLHESLFSAKLFLTSALHESVMRVLIEDDQPLDVDPLRTIAGLPTAERHRRFGLEGTGEFEAKSTQFRAATLRKLHRLAAGCMQSLHDNWTLFPSTLRWVVQTMCHLLKSAHIPAGEINHILTDMVFTHFICPAVVSPDLFGITDAPVSENARHNLIQIGQVMQMLALTRHEQVDGRFGDLLAMFGDENVVAELMEQLQVTEYDVSVSMMAIPHQNDFGRDHVLVTQRELNVFVAFLRGVLEFDGLSVSGEDRRKLGRILDQLPDRWETVMMGGGTGGTTTSSVVDTLASGAGGEPTTTSGGRTKQSLISLGKSTKSRLAKTIHLSGAAAVDAAAIDDAAGAGGDELTTATAHNNNHNNNNNNTIGLELEFEQVLIIPIAINDESKFQLLTEQEVLNMNNISSNSRSAGNATGLDPLLKKSIDPDDDDEGDDDADDDDDGDDDDDDDDDVGNVVSGSNVTVSVMERKLLMARQHGAAAAAAAVVNARQRQQQQQQQRYDDQQSIGNASDNLEAVSEVPSNHSVTSSVEMEEHYQHLNDNLSDMVSANVSGRGSPNISGRDTPSSQVTEDAGGGGGGGIGGGNIGGGGENVLIGGVLDDDPLMDAASTVSNRMLARNSMIGSHLRCAGNGGGLPSSVQMAKILNKTRSDIDDKFGKFEIGRQPRAAGDGIDETVSIISDTWSTDVLASDSETLEAGNGGGGGMDRNFASRQIASGTGAGVMLPGDRDFDILRGGGGGGSGAAGGPMLPGSGGGGSSLLDASETRSESAWSTDVLASDSEKLIEIDTDDNNSVTANSDVGAPSTGIASAMVPLVPMSLVTTSRPRGGGSGAVPTMPTAMPSGATVTGSNGASRVRISSDEFARFLGPIVGSTVSNIGNNVSNVGGSSSSAASLMSAGTAAVSSSAAVASAVLPSIGVYGGCCPATNTLATSVPMKASSMRRQHSAESSISTQSSSSRAEMDVFNGMHHQHRNHHHHQRGPHASRVLKTNTNITNPFACSATSPAGDEDDECNDDDEDDNNNSAVGRDLRRRSRRVVNGDLLPLVDSGDDDDDDVEDDSVDPTVVAGTALVEQRIVTAAQRSTSYDGRRNGIMSAKVLSMGGSGCSYENHEIIFKVRAASMNDAAGIGAATAAPVRKTDDDGSSITDDDKTRQQQQQQLQRPTANNNSSSSLVDQTLALHLSEATTDQTMTAAQAKTSASRYTGTIPKSISFDDSADKRSFRHSNSSNYPHCHPHDGSNAIVVLADSSTTSGNGLRHHHQQQQQHTNTSGFFNKLKQGFRNRRSHHGAHKNGSGSAIAAAAALAAVGSEQSAAILGADALLLDHATMTTDGNGTSAATAAAIDGCDDILAKYRRKISSSSEATNSDSLSATGGRRPNSQTEADAAAANAAALLDDAPLMLMNNAKRKLRLVLSTTDLHTADFRHTSCRKIPPLMTYLQIQLAQALNLQHLQQIAVISETIRCLRQLDDAQLRQLIADLQVDLRQRQSYLQYLMRYRQHLLSALENIDRFEDRLRNDREMCNRHLIMVCVRLFLEKRQPWLERFQAEFGALTVVDEKIDCMTEFMDALMAELLAGGGALHTGLQLAWQQREARAWIERALLQKLYRQVMFPNDDADVSRDEVLRIHIDKLSRLITPAHVSLRIPHEYRIEAPWPFAQQQIAYISAYKTPREKVQCVVRCITSIMNLLQMACSRSPAADDLVPVLIFVVIKANPPYLMSTIQYVNAFIGNELEGADHYWWTQFSAAVTFIKTMDYNH